MKRIFLLLAGFVAGVAAGAATIWFLFAHSFQTIYSGALEQQANTALQLRLGEQERFLKDFEFGAPGYVMAVHDFGNHDYTRKALQKVKAYYDVSGIVVPAEIASFLSDLPSNPAAKTPSQDGKQETLTTIGDVSSILSAQTIDGEPLDFNGRVVLLNFFATWCGPCMAEMPALQKNLWEPLKEEGLIVAAVGREHSEAELKAFRTKQQYSFLFIADPKRGIFGKFAKESIPRAILIGKDGRI